MRPSLTQLLSIIQLGNDSVDNVLILLPNGDFELVQGVGYEAVKGRDYVCRWETYDANDGWIGTNVSCDNVHIASIMKSAEEAWEEYIQLGKKRMLKD